MSRRAPRRTPSKPHVRKPLRPNFPEHDHPAPYARLLTFGPQDDPAAYDEIADALQRGDGRAAAAKLTEMALDVRYYDYFDPDYPDDPRETRNWTRLHAVRALMRMGEAAQSAMEPLLPLLGEEDDTLREEMPFFYAAIGKAAIAPLTRQLLDEDADHFVRIGAGDALQELAEAHPERRGEIVPILEQALTLQEDNDELAAFLVCNLLDVKATESLPIIEQAFREERVDESIVQMADVEEHLGLPRVTPHKRVYYNLSGQHISVPDEENVPPGALDGVEDEDEDPVPVPYVAELKVGRNDPCPCGSGKKYKKCCGA